MATKKQKGLAFPVKPAALLETIGLTEEQSTSQCRITILVDASLDEAFLAYAKDAFRPQTDNVALTVEAYFDEPARVGDDESLLVVLAADAPATELAFVEALRAQVPVVVVTLDPARFGQEGGEHAGVIDVASMVTTDTREDEEEEARLERLFEALGAWIVRRLPDEQLVLARAFPFVRDPFIANAIQATSVQNAVIAAVFFLPGADMPLLTLNQVKLFLRIAAAHDVTVDRQRLGELLLLLAGGFGFRALARRLIGVVPVLGWAIRGGVGYAGTLAVGKAAQEYFARGGSPKSLAESLLPRGKASL
jgi:uncharacterized protein (DUF697 family)